VLSPDGPLGAMLAAGAVVADPLGAARGGQDHHRAAAGRRNRPAFRPDQRDLHRRARPAQGLRGRQDRRQNGQGTLLFVDEIHRFNKAQQDGFLPHMEDGTILLVGATTENPSFELNAALLSRAQVIVLERLSLADLERLAQRGRAGAWAAPCR
jgi:putative ATPase